LALLDMNDDGKFVPEERPLRGRMRP